MSFFMLEAMPTWGVVVFIALIAAVVAAAFGWWGRKK